MKKMIYLSAFIIFGILLQFLAHAAVEVWYIKLLLTNFSKYGLGFSWDFWLWAHHIGAVILLITGALFGFWQGKYWWRRIYEEGLLEKKYRWIPWI